MTPAIDEALLRSVIATTDIIGPDDIPPERWDLYAGTTARIIAREYNARAARGALTPDPAEPRPFCPQCGYESCKHGYRPDRPAEPGLREALADLMRGTEDWAEYVEHPVTIRMLRDIRTALDTARTEGLDVERLRVATWRLSNAADALGRYARRADDPGHRSWFPSAIADVEREIALARDAAGPAPTTAEYARLAHPEDAALEHRS